MIVTQDYGWSQLARRQGMLWPQATDRAEVVGPGDLDYPAIAAALAAKRRKPLLVVEHAYEDGTPDTLDPVAAHRQSLTYVANTCGAA